MKNIGFLFLFCFLLSCQQSSPFNNERSESKEFSDEQADYSGNSTTTITEDEESSPKDQPLKPDNRKIIKTANIRFQVTDLKVSTKRIEALTEQFSGFLGNMNQTNSNYSINNALSIKIPNENFDRFVEAIQKESIYTNHIRISSTDVTEEFTDNTIRLATKKEVRDRYIEILRNKAKTVKDVLAAEETIRKIQEEIESIEGRLKYLKSRTSLSTINLQIYQEVAYAKAPTVYKRSFGSQLVEGFLGGFELIKDILIGLVNIWPLLLLGFFLFFFRKRLFASFKRKG